MMWDDIYSDTDYVYGKQPNDFLKANVSELKKGRVLCLAEGEGRNAVFLARHGFSVTAVDSSLVGVNKTRALAEENNVDVDAVHSDLADFDIGHEQWDSIVSIFCHLPPALRKSVHESVAEGLCRGGVFLLEAYTPKQLEYGTGGPPSAELMFTLDMVRQELPGLELVHQQELEREVIEGYKHNGLASVVQVIAMWTSNNMCSNKAVTYTLTCVSASTDSCVYSAGFATNQNGYVTTTDKFTSDEANFCSFSHRISRFDSRNQSACLDHSECNAVVVICHF